MSQWPTWATEPVVVVPWDPAWTSLAQDLIADLDVLLEPWLHGNIQHVGARRCRICRPSRSST